jgi:hypothetical protein
MPGALSAVAQEFVSNQNIHVVCGICSLANLSGVEFSIKHPIDFDIEYLLKGGEGPGQPAVFLRSEVVKYVGNLIEKLHYTLDWEYWIRVSSLYPNIQSSKLEKTLAVWCQWEDCKSVGNRVGSYKERFLVLDNLFAHPNLPENVHNLQKMAYSRAFSKLAVVLAEVKDWKEAFRYSLRGFMKFPSFFGLKKMSKVFAMYTLSKIQ